MKCPEISPLLPRFFDGELEGRQMRAVALHVTRCADCELELRQLEALQGLVAAQVAERVEAIDMSRIWIGVAARMEQVPLSWQQRLAARAKAFELPTVRGAWPALAGAAAVAVLTLGVWTYQDGKVDPSPGVREASIAAAPRPVEVEVAKIDEEEVADAISDELVNSAVFDSIVGSVRELTVDPETGTTVVWVSDSGEMP